MNKNDFARNSHMLIIMERKEDPITPLITNWGYQALLHELIGIDNNKI